MIAANKLTIDDQINHHLIKVCVYNCHNVTLDVQAQLAEATGANRIPDRRVIHGRGAVLNQGCECADRRQRDCRCQIGHRKGLRQHARRVGSRWRSRYSDRQLASGLVLAHNLGADPASVGYRQARIPGPGPNCGATGPRHAARTSATAVP